MRTNKPEENDMKLVGILVGVICAIAVIVVVFLARPASPSTVLATRCHLADEAHLDFHPLDPDYIGKLVAQQMRDDGVKDNETPDGYEVQHAAKVVVNLCLP